MKTFKIAFYLLLAFLLFFLISGCQGTDQEESQTHSLQSQTASPELMAEINEALQKVVASREDVLAFIIYKVQVDHIDLSEDGALALVWINLIDPESGLTLPSENGLAIAKKLNPGEPWTIYLQADSTWINQQINNICTAHIISA